MSTQIIALVDKTVVRLRGVCIRGLRPQQLEDAVGKRTGRMVRVIGVTGDAVEMDLYGLSPEEVLRDEAGIVRAVSAVEGVTAGEVAHIESAHAPVVVDADSLTVPGRTGCPGERFRSP